MYETVGVGTQDLVTAKTIYEKAQSTLDTGWYPTFIFGGIDLATAPAPAVSILNELKKEVELAGEIRKTAPEK